MTYFSTSSECEINIDPIYIRERGLFCHCLLRANIRCRYRVLEIRMRHKKEITKQGDVDEKVLLHKCFFPATLENLDSRQFDVSFSGE